MRIDRTRRLSLMEGDELLEMFHLNKEGFKKKKECP
jgi:hypothetical protein